MADLGKALDNPVLEFLHQRRSCHHLIEPGPDDIDVALILRAALRVPDFRNLKPYRFLVARGAGRERLGQAMQRAAIAAGKADDVVSKALKMPMRAPMVIVVVACPKEDKYVPVFDQQLCAGATVLLMQQAAMALGYGGIWRSGWLMYDRGFHQELGLGGCDQIVGFLYLGTPMQDDAEVNVPLRGELSPDLLSWV